MGAIKSVLLIVTRTGYVEGVFTSLRALANSRGALGLTLKASMSLTLRLT